MDNPKAPEASATAHHTNKEESGKKKRRVEQGDDGPYTPSRRQVDDLCLVFVCCCDFYPLLHYSPPVPSPRKNCIYRDPLPAHNRGQGLPASIQWYCLEQQHFRARALTGIQRTREQRRLPPGRLSPISRSIKTKSWTTCQGNTRRKKHMCCRNTKTSCMLSLRIIREKMVQYSLS